MWEEYSIFFGRLFRYGKLLTHFLITIKLLHATTNEAIKCRFVWNGYKYASIVNCDDCRWKLFNFNQLLKHKIGYLLAKSKEDEKEKQAHFLHFNCWIVWYSYISLRTTEYHRNKRKIKSEKSYDAVQCKGDNHSGNANL